MENKYYDIEIFSKIKDLFRLNPYSALTKAERYLNKYPKDYSAYVEYAKMLCVVE